MPLAIKSVVISTQNTPFWNFSNIYFLYSLLFYPESTSTFFEMSIPPGPFFKIFFN